METVNRILQEKITARIAPNKAVLIFGARRVGKTVMMRKIVDNYSGRTMMLNGEDYDTLALLENRSIANFHPSSFLCYRLGWQEHPPFL